MANYVVLMNNASYHTFSNMRILIARSHAVYTYYGNGVEFSNCIVGSAGGYGIQMFLTSNAVVRNCEVYGVGNKE